jgi:hypothetical protein
MKKSYDGEGFIADIDLEIDDDGTPYYVGSILKRTKLNGLPVVKGVIILNPVSGDISEYDLDEVPNWVDRVYPENVLIQYINIWGKYKKGFKNSLFAKEGVLVASTEANGSSQFEIIYINGEPHIWTGYQRSASSNDEVSTINPSVNGIVIASLKTGKISYYEVAGVSEAQAQAVAEGLVQEKGYKASFPVPIKCNDTRAMFMIMRDDNKNIVGYTLVSYDDYTKSAYATSIKDVVTKFFGNAGENVEITISNEKPKVLTGIISAVATEVVDGRTVYYFIIEDKVFTCNSKVNTNIVFAKEGYKVKIEYLPSKNGNIYVIKNFEYIETDIFEITNN